MVSSSDRNCKGVHGSGTSIDDQICLSQTSVYGVVCYDLIDCAFCLGMKPLTGTGDVATETTGKEAGHAANLRR